MTPCPLEMENGTGLVLAMTLFMMTHSLTLYLGSTITKATATLFETSTKPSTPSVASPLYPAYNQAVCWAGYINVVTKALACDYYDAVTAGILAKIRKHHDKPAYDFSAKTISAHIAEFMFWGPNTRLRSLENNQAMATVCWLGQLLLIMSLQLPDSPKYSKQRRKPDPKPNNQQVKKPQPTAKT